MLKLSTLILVALISTGCASTKPATIIYQCPENYYVPPELPSAIGETYESILIFEQQCLSQLLRCNGQ